MGEGHPMNCPYCRISYVAHTETRAIGESSNKTGRLLSHNYPEWNKNYHGPGSGIFVEDRRDFSDSILLYPNLQSDLLGEYKEDFEEAYNLLDFSPKASAALIDIRKYFSFHRINFPLKARPSL